MCDGFSFIDIEVLLRQVLTHLLMPRKALCRFIQLSEKCCWGYSEWGNVSEPANLDWPLFRAPHFLNEHIATDFFQNLLSGSRCVVFLSQTQCARNEISRVADLVLVILVQFNLLICVVQQQFEREKPVVIGFGLQLKLRISCCLQWLWIKPQMVARFL